MKIAVSLSLGSLLFAAVTLNAQKINIIKVPGGTNAVPAAISPWGEIVGSYQDNQSKEFRAFVRMPNGKITTFDDPNAQFPVPTVVNAFGVIAGSEFPNSSRFQRQGFVRSPLGKITQFNPSPVIAPDDTDVNVTGINSQGVVVGFYADTLLFDQSFLRTPDGKITVVDLVGPGAFPGTFITAINDAGECTGAYTPNQSFDSSGFLRRRDGSVTSFTVLNATSTFPTAINLRGEIAGYWSDSITNHGFVRNAGGRITTIDFPGAESTTVSGIDLRGRVAGSFYDAGGFSHGFIREVNGAFRKIDAPGAENTFVTSMNELGEAIGNFDGSNGVSGGFVVAPEWQVRGPGLIF